MYPPSFDLILLLLYNKPMIIDLTRIPNHNIEMIETIKMIKILKWLITTKNEWRFKISVDRETPNWSFISKSRTSSIPGPDCQLGFQKIQATHGETFQHSKRTGRALINRRVRLRSQNRETACPPDSYSQSLGCHHRNGRLGTSDHSISKTDGLNTTLASGQRR